MTTYKFLLFAVLVLSHLSSALLIEVSIANFGLQLLKLVRLLAGLLDLALLLFVDDLELLHLARKVLLHGHEVEGVVVVFELSDIDRVERG